MSFQPPEPPQKTFHNEEAEQALLGAMLGNNRVYAAVAGIVSAEDFFVGVHATLFDLIATMVMEGKTANPITLKHYFETDPDLLLVGGASYLVDLVQNVVTYVNAPHYANLVRDLSTARQAMARLMEGHNFINTEAESGAEIVTAISTVIGDLEKLNFRGDISQFRSKIVEKILDAMDLPKRRDSTGIASIDNAMKGGLYAGFTYGIAAKEKQGKTTLAHSISYNLNQNGVKHAYIALEMGSKQIEERNLARAMRVNSLEFLKTSTPLRRQIIAEKAKSIPDNIIYIDLPGGTYEGLKSEIARLHIRYRIHGAIVDYWQLVGGRDKRETEESHLRTVAQGLADLGRRLDIWIIIIAQLNSDGTKTFAGSGIKKACDQLYYLHRLEDEGKDHLAWMQAVASRYSMLEDVGSKTEPGLFLNTTVGPYFSDVAPDDTLDMY